MRKTSKVCAVLVYVFIAMTIVGIALTYMDFAEAVSPNGTEITPLSEIIAVTVLSIGLLGTLVSGILALIFSKTKKDPAPINKFAYKTGIIGIVIIGMLVACFVVYLLFIFVVLLISAQG